LNAARAKCLENWYQHVQRMTLRKDYAVIPMEEKIFGDPKCDRN
jgi:hypothetical protein